MERLSQEDIHQLYTKIENIEESSRAVQYPLKIIKTEDRYMMSFHKPGAVSVWRNVKSSIRGVFKFEHAEHGFVHAERISNGQYGTAYSITLGDESRPTAVMKIQHVRGDPIRLYGYREKHKQAIVVADPWYIEVVALYAQNQQMYPNVPQLYCTLLVKVEKDKAALVEDERDKTALVTIVDMIRGHTMLERPDPLMLPRCVLQVKKHVTAIRRDLDMVNYDLNSGNILYDARGNIFFIDPAMSVFTFRGTTYVVDLCDLNKFNDKVTAASLPGTHKLWYDRMMYRPLYSGHEDVYDEIMDNLRKEVRPEIEDDDGMGGYAMRIAVGEEKKRLSAGTYNDMIDKTLAAVDDFVVKCMRGGGVVPTETLSKETKAITGFSMQDSFGLEYVAVISGYVLVLLIAGSPWEHKRYSEATPVGVRYMRMIDEPTPESMPFVFVQPEAAVPGQ